MKQMGLAYGWGISDSPTRNPDKTKCKIYTKWYDMVKRSHSQKYITKYPSYEGCSVSDEWRRSSDFKIWMSCQNWEGLELDKDILIQNNKIYSSETCTFVPKYLNYLLLTRDRCRGEYPLGVKQRPVDKRYPNSPRSEMLIATVNDGSGRTIYLGSYSEPMPAHKAWQQAKRDVILNALVKYRSESFYRKDVDDALILRADRLNDDLTKDLETTNL